MSKQTVRRVFGFAAAALALVVVGCSSEAVEEAPAVDADALDEEVGTIYNGAFSATASTSFMGFYDVGQWRYSQIRANASFTGPSARRMGVCLLKSQYNGTGLRPCSTVADCGTPRPGGYAYCVDPYGGGQKHCFERPGTQTAWCAGSPALPGAPPITPGPISTPTYTLTEGSYWGQGAYWLSYACFEGCTQSDPATSAIGWTYGPQFRPCGGEPMCGNQCC
jgi:hypothetical protein